MIYHAVVTLLAHMGGYVLRKTFVEASFRMNTLIRLQLKNFNFTADKIGKTFSFHFNAFGWVLSWKSYDQKINFLNSYMINKADLVFQ